MNDRRIRDLKNVARASVTYLIQIIGVASFLFAFPLRQFSLHLFNTAYFDLIRINHVLTSILSLLLVLLGMQLRKRMRMAWYMAMLSLPALMMLTVIRTHILTPYLIVFEMLIYLMLVSDHDYYQRRSQQTDVKKSMLVILFAFGLLVFITTIRIYVLKEQLFSIKDWGAALSSSFSLLFLMDTSIVPTSNRLVSVLVDSTITLQWTMIVLSLVLLFTPYIMIPRKSALDRQKVRDLLMRFSANPIDYVLVEKDKNYFFPKGCEGVIGYVLAAKTAVVAGEPVCAKENALQVLIEFRNYCRENDLDIVFVQTSDRLLEEFRQLHFGIAKYGEEAMFDLTTYTTNGNKAQKVRYAFNRATREGVVVREYKPQIKRDPKIEAEIQAISKQWLKNKKSSELSFTLGSVGLDEPLDKRYFVAYDQLGRSVAFVVFTPFAGGDGYHADVTRRLDDAPQGTMEKIILSAFEIMKKEGVHWGSLGLAPLANLNEESSKSSVTERLLDLVYERMNAFYGFKSLYHYKKGYNPNHWITRYLVFSPALFTPKTAYALLKAQNSKGVGDYLLVQLKNIGSRDDKAEEPEGK
ncbi:MAG: DUF2156 domain-containing protein [Erysipelotrichaceae bacterium]